MAARTDPPTALADLVGAIAHRLRRAARRCVRRRRTLAPLAHAILRAKDAGRPLTLAAWTALLSLVVFFGEATAAGVLPATLALFTGLVVIALFDAGYFVIPDAPIVFLAVTGLAGAGAAEETPAKLAAAVAGYASLRFASHAYEWARGAPGVGVGDARLFAVAGLWIGFGGLPSALFYGALSALFSALMALRQGILADARAPLPFGPHLALGIWLVWVFGPLAFG